MNDPILFIPARKRVRRKRRVVSAPAPAGPLTITTIDHVAVEEGAVHVFVLLNTTAAEPLEPVSGADPSKWSVRYQGERYDGMTLELIDYRTLKIVAGYVTSEAGEDEMSYAGPSDISDALGRVLGAFSDRPLNDEV